MASYLAPTACTMKPFNLYSMDRAGNLINDQYPDYLRVPREPLTDEEMDAYEKLMPRKLEIFLRLKMDCTVDELNLMTEYVDQEGELISVSDEWDRKVAEHVRLVIAPPGPVEDTSSDNDDDDDDCASTASDDSDVSLPRPYLDSSGDFTYTSEEEDERRPQREAAVQQNPSKQAPLSKPQFMATEAEVQYKRSVSRVPEPSLYQSVGRENSPTRNSHNIFVGPHAPFLHDLFCHVDRHQLLDLCLVHKMTGNPDVSFMKKMQTWGLLSFEKGLRLTNYIEFVKSSDSSAASLALDREASKANIRRNSIRSNLGQILRKTVVERAILLATEMSKPDMAKKLKDTYSKELATLFVKSPTAVFILDNALRKTNQVIGVKAVSRDKVPAAFLVAGCFVDLNVRSTPQQTQKDISHRNAYAAQQAANARSKHLNKEPTPAFLFEEEWRCSQQQAEEHLENHVMAFKILAGDYKSNPEAVEILHEHAECLKHCVPTFTSLQEMVQDTTHANRHLMTPAHQELSTDLLNTLQKFKDLPITTIEEALAHLTDQLDPEDEVRDDASGSYENDSEEDDNE